MRGAYTQKINYSDCIYGAAGKYYQDIDFSEVMNCQKKPIISDLPREKSNDTQVRKLPSCCRNGSILPTIMDSSQSKAVFQLQVYKIPPNMNRTALYPPEKWKIEGVVNLNYKCGQPLKVDPTLFPGTSGLQATSTAMATWQIVCNISRPKNGKSRCCVSFSAYYNESVIPCETCACGCDADDKCIPNGKAMLLPAEALLIPFKNRTTKAKAWASLKHFLYRKSCPAVTIVESA
ncbi:hypothetical protein QYF36_014698 [Acer negundo]|nr:hypothetical protein QYF36_014698 [Acer negundo]